ncbi:hypothetical protein E4U13_004988 [Claviceps humidiphila]|uniref:Uncharacterized protein n=2 Tax=Claviceps TaxID=5110 RepID=A0A9P7Q821_9HYPO|nr:hypothetical protein E4U56_002914 [Claviceps arundinis]KAG6123520.1 hypothetical protein E4U13_004988 [Claviceps humidiphila]
MAIRKDTRNKGRTSTSDVDVLADMFGRMSLEENTSTGQSSQTDYQEYQRQYVRVTLFQLQYVRATLQRRQILRALAAGGGDFANKKPSPSLATEDCVRYFPLPCSDDAWNQLLEDFPEDEVVLRQLGKADVSRRY